MMVSNLPASLNLLLLFGENFLFDFSPFKGFLAFLCPPMIGPILGMEAGHLCFCGLFVSDLAYLPERQLAGF